MEAESSLAKDAALYKIAAETFVLYYPRLQALKTLVNDRSKDNKFTQALQQYQKVYQGVFDDLVAEALRNLSDKVEAEGRDWTQAELNSTQVD